MENSRRKIFIGGLPANITEAQLKEHFAHYGTVGCFTHLLIMIINNNKVNLYMASKSKKKSLDLLMF